MKSINPLAFAIAACLCLFSDLLIAHHAASSYDRAHPITLSGPVTAFLFVSPHVQIRFDAKDENGNVTNWTAELGPPQRLFRSGWNKTTLQPGDNVTVTGAPAKDGKYTMSVIKVVGPDGKVFNLGS